MTEINQIALANLVGELALIKDEGTRRFTKECILRAPGAYWRRASAYYHGHHPEDEQTDWGNLRHVKKVIKVIMALAEMINLPQEELDPLLAGMTIHDIGKYGVDGECEKIQTNHPDLVVEFVSKHDLTCLCVATICRVARTHMGRWGHSQPVSRIEKLGHYADFLASRTVFDIPVDLEVNNGR